MATVEITNDNLQDTIDTHEIVLLDFWASWCAPCRRFAPIFEKASEAHGDIAFGKIDTQAQTDLARQFGIQSIPTTAVFRDGILLHMQPGLLPAEGLESLITQVRALDMEDVKRKIAEHEAQQHAK